MIANHKLVVCGIDPGYRTGWCVWDGDKILKITTCPKEKMLDVLRQMWEDGVVTVIGVEVSTSTHIYRRKNVSQKALLRIATDVGQNKAEALRIVGLAQGLGFKVVQVNPFQSVTNRGIRIRTKIDPILFKKITGYHGRTSSHARDAWGVARQAYTDVYFCWEVSEDIRRIVQTIQEEGR